MQPESLATGVLTEAYAFSQSTANTLTGGYFDATRSNSVIEHTYENVLPVNAFQNAAKEFTSESGDIGLGALYTLKGLGQTSGIGLAFAGVKTSPSSNSVKTVRESSVKVESSVVPNNNASVIDDLVTVDRHGTLKRNQAIPGQSHHLNQNAAFKSVIPENEAVAVKLEGNAFTEIGSPHYNAHESLESFWQPYRRGGDLHPTVPTNKEYTRALHQSLLDSGMSDANAWHATKAAMKQRVEYGLKGIDEVPKVPQRMGQKHRQ